MHYCQRAIMTSDELGWFAVSDKYYPENKFGYRLCGKPAFFCQVGPYIVKDPNRKVELWLCTECFNEYEAHHGEGSWEWTVEDYAQFGRWDNDGNWHQDEASKETTHG